MKSSLVDITVRVHFETEKAYRVSIDGDNDNAVWIAKSQCELECTGLYSEITLEEWLAKEKGLI